MKLIMIINLKREIVIPTSTWSLPLPVLYSSTHNAHFPCSFLFGASPFYPFAVEHNAFDTPHIADVSQRISFDQHQIRKFAGFNTSQAIGGMKEPRILQSTSDDRLHRSKARIHEQFQLTLISPTALCVW